MGGKKYSHCFVSAGGGVASSCCVDTGNVLVASSGVAVNERAASLRSTNAAKRGARKDPTTNCIGCQIKRGKV
eukprot:scaffold54397_cov62-Attheya_sp.AAC.2